MNKNLDDAVLEVREALACDERIMTYKTVKHLIESDGTLQQLWEQQKSIQKELVHAKAYGLENQKNQCEHELAHIEKQLASHPLMEAYQEAYQDILDIQTEIEEIVFGE
ncbi:MAG: YlbF family regulator [Culicoidibacterales bacterium]